MADVTKYHHNIISHIRTHFKTTKSSGFFVYVIVLFFILFTLFLAFNSPSSTSTSSPWFTISSPATTLSVPSNFSPVFSCFFHSSTQNITTFKDGNFEPNDQKQSNESHVGIQISQNNPSRSSNFTISQLPISQNSTKSSISVAKGKNFEQNCINVTCSDKKQSKQSINSTKTQVLEEKVQNLKDQSCIDEQCEGKKQRKQGDYGNSNSRFVDLLKEGNGNAEKGVKEKFVVTDFSASLSKKHSVNGVNMGDLGGGKKQGNGESDLVAKLVNCDLYDGEWIRDESYPLYEPDSCTLIDGQFNCVRNGRPDVDYHKLKWKPKGCTLPRLNGEQMLKILSGKRLVLIGDSLNRNMWESLVCILRNSVNDTEQVYEAFGRHSFRTEASYSFVFKDYNFTVEFFVAPFLVQQWEVKDKNGEAKETLRLDLFVRDNDQFKDADFLVFNTGHWWTHEKTSKGEDYYQERYRVYKQLDVVEAFRKAIITWAKWVDANINPNKTHVLFRGYSASHFSGGRWNSGGQCDGETEPIRNETYLMPYPWKMEVLESVLKRMKTPVSYLNVTRMTDYRKDGHPSIFRKQHIISEEERKSPLMVQDCSHWCLPGVPDSWNELLYAEFLRKQYKDQQQKCLS